MSCKSAMSVFLWRIWKAYSGYIHAIWHCVCYITSCPSSCCKTLQLMMSTHCTHWLVLNQDSSKGKKHYSAGEMLCTQYNDQVLLIQTPAVKQVYCSSKNKVCANTNHILPFNIQFEDKPLPWQKVVRRYVWYGRYCLQLLKSIDSLLISSKIFEGKRNT